MRIHVMLLSLQRTHWCDRYNVSLQGIPALPQENKYEIYPSDCRSIFHLPVDESRCMNKISIGFIESVKGNNGINNVPSITGEIIGRVIFRTSPTPWQSRNGLPHTGKEIFPADQTGQYYLHTGFHNMWLSCP